jgi:hypothetical protein
MRSGRMLIGVGCLAVLVAALGPSACGSDGDDGDDSAAKTFESGIILQKASLNATANEADLDAAKRQFDALVSKVDPGASGTTGRVATFPSLTYAPIGLSTVPDGQSQLTFLFEGQNEYVINCQSTPEQRETLKAACDQALRTLKPA